MAPIYDYQAYTSSGKQVRGIIEAETVKAARQKLKKKQMMVTGIQEKSGKKKSSSRGGSFGGRVSLQDISLLTRQMASLIKANVPLVEALTALVDQTEKEKLKVVLDHVKRDVNEGSSLAKALAGHPKHFDYIFINMVEAGESSGTLGLVLLRLAELKEAQLRLRTKIRSAMTYPILMMFVAVAILVLIFVWVIPELSQIFESMNKPVPMSTQILIIVSDYLTTYWYLFLTAVFMAFFLFNRYISSKKGKVRWDRFKITAPVIGSLLRMIAVARFARTMSTLLGSGVPILTGMQISRNLVGNVHIERAIDDARENVTEGQSIAIPLKKSGQFPPMVIHMISIGEKTGELPDMLRNVADTFEEQISAKIEGLTSLLEPAMIVLMGGIVLFIVLSIFLPLLEISNLN